MQAIESQNLILYQTDLRGQWPQEAAAAFARRLPYARAHALRSVSAAGRASLAGIALALRALTALLGRSVEPRELVFAHGQKPRLAVSSAPAPAADFSISHTGPWAACAALAGGRVGLDLEEGTDARIADWVVREAALKATGDGLRAFSEIARVAMQSDRLRWRGQVWHVRRLQGFAGACACVVSSVAVPAVDTRVVGSAELFVT